ncbi:MAG TPA: replicative DNA helicase [Sphingobacteriaceae bacterium]|nr:replicative DNA helicase [Sphingobacteriaceae bacterium]
MNTSPDRVPPQSLEAEQSVLGAMLISREAVPLVTEILRPEDFYRDAHRIIYEAMLELADQAEAIDTVTVSERLRARRDLERVGGVSYLTSLAHSVPTAANVEHYARLVEEKSLLRRLIRAAGEISEDGYRQEEDVDVILDRSEQRIFNLAHGRRIQGYRSLSDIMLLTFEHLEELFANKGQVIGISTGFERLDEMTSGLHPSELIIIAARPSVGKTTLALNITCHAAAKQVPVGFFSLEMSAEQLAMRLLASESWVDMHRLRTGYFNDRDFTRLTEAAGRLSGMPILIDDTPNISIMELRAKARRMKAEYDVGMIVVDYLQLMHAKGRAENRQQEISEISRSLKALARELRVPVVALSQLSRAVEQRERKRPQLSDLRESGAIEQDADVVMFLYQDPENKDESMVVDLILAKQRNGPTGTIKLAFRKDVGRFTETTPEEEEPGFTDEALAF